MDPALSSTKPMIAAAAPRPTPLVEVRGLTRQFGETTALRNVSFEVQPGEIFGFIGPNGAGKTTTLRILATLLEPSSGEARVDGMCTVNDTDAVRRVIGYMPDQFGVYDGVTVTEYLDFFASAYRLPRRRRTLIIRDVLELTDLGPLRDRSVATLSQGLKQRLCLAKTLIHDPKLLLLDEPASALDPRARIELRVLLKELRRMGKTIIISSHILTELSDLCTSFAIIEKGAVVESGSMESLAGRSWEVDRVKITLHAAWEGVEKILLGCPEVGAVAVEDRRVEFDYRGAPEEFHRVLKLLVDHSVPIVAVERESRSLERLFLKLTQGDVR
jgi:ABC-2 type transport system ATP-binding protein